jgi:hypothetical protein
MRGDIVFRIYGVHEGRAEDMFFGCFRTRAEADAAIAAFAVKTLEDGTTNWAAKYHNRGFVVREHAVTTDFEIPSRQKPRDRYFVKTSAVKNRPGTWDSTRVEVFRRRPENQAERVGEYLRTYNNMLQTFEPFRQGARELALISRDYTVTAVMDLATGEIIAEENEKDPGYGFCPVGFYVPDWCDVNDGSVIPGSKYWDADKEWPTGDFGFVWGCYWGDDSSWKVQHLDLRRVQEGIIARDDRFGYVELVTGHHRSPCLRPDAPVDPSHPPDFINLSRDEGQMRVRFAVQVGFDLTSGQIDKEAVERLLAGEKDPV